MYLDDSIYPLNWCMPSISKLFGNANNDLYFFLHRRGTFQAVIQHCCYEQAIVLTYKFAAK